MAAIPGICCNSVNITPHRPNVVFMKCQKRQQNWILHFTCFSSCCQFHTVWEVRIPSESQSNSISTVSIVWPPDLKYTGSIGINSPGCQQCSPFFLQYCMHRYCRELSCAYIRCPWRTNSHCKSHETHSHKNILHNVSATT